MSLIKALENYLATRHALGYKLRYATRTLPKFVDFLERKKMTYITTELALRWVQEEPKASFVTRADRLTVVRRFAAWRSATDPRTEIPSPGLLPRHYRRPTPYIYSTDEIHRILTAARRLPSVKGLRGSTCFTLFGLLAVTGMRVAEATSLDRGDVDLKERVITIRHGKSGRIRYIPVHATTRNALESYTHKRNTVFPRPPQTLAFFISDHGRRVSPWCAGHNFAEVSRRIGLRPKNGGRFGRGPRLHDLRHRFAVTTLIRWYRAGADVEREMPKLATYLGHAQAANTYWYLQAVPELLNLATERLERVVKEGVR